MIPARPALRSCTVNVFTGHRPYVGNPLGVVLDADPLADATMQQIATETDYSETVFVMSARLADADAWPVRIFTPAREIAFAGHPILGAAWVIRQRMQPGCKDLRLRLAVGPVPVAFEPDGEDGEVAWFAAPPIVMGKLCPAERIAAALALPAGDIDAQLPVQDVSADTSALLVPLRSLDALCRARLDLAAFGPLARDGFAPRVYLFTRETRDSANDVCARFFFEANGVREDPASGNAAAFLGAYLLEHGVPLAQRGSPLRIEQGHLVGRPSLVLLQARQGVRREIRVGGRVEWHISP
jgi:trans-2,3-dihydro-3-hydroxyanthranilate isomerase